MACAQLKLCAYVNGDGRRGVKSNMPAIAEGGLQGTLGKFADNGRV
jgi:cell shape-determining protein MreC